MQPDVYLGDGLYAAFDGYQIELYASDGLSITNRVYLDPRVLVAFEAYVESLRKPRASDAEVFSAINSAAAPVPTENDHA